MSNISLGSVHTYHLGENCWLYEHNDKYHLELLFKTGNTTKNDVVINCIVT